MSDLISRQAAIDTLADMHCKSDEDGYVWIIRSDAWARIDALPSVQPERKKGKWKMALVKDLIGFNTVCFRCSECNCMEYSTSPFCRMCGAKMGEGEQE